MEFYRGRHNHSLIGVCPYFYIFIGVVILFFYIKFLEKKGIYYPLPHIDFSPKDIGLPYEDLYITTKDNLIINAWFIPQKEAKYTLVFAHGNAGNISHRLEKISLLYPLGWNIFIFDYRGYGRSQGKPDEAGLYQDMEAVYEYLLKEKKISPEEIILYGESLGTAVVIKLASERKVRALILEGAFSCGKDMARRIYPFLPNFLFRNSFDSLSRIKNINFPKLFLHSREDEIVPFKLAKKLYDSASAPKKLVELVGGHNSCFLDAEETYISGIDKFLKELDGYS